MEISVDKQSPLGLKEQIKRQIRILAQAGELIPGQALPPAKDLAGLLNVNRNTVSQAYKELALEGILETRKGSGTFVGDTVEVENLGDLDRILDEALRQARGLGISTEKAADYLLQRLMNRFAGTPRRRVLVVDCNQDVISDLSSGIQDRIGAETKGVLIQTLEAADDTAGFFEGIDLVVCGINHVEEFRRAVPDCPVELVGVWLRPDLKVMNALLNLPPGSRVGYTCVNQRSTETLFNTQFFSTGSSLVRVLTGFDRESGLPDMLASCDIIFATHYVYDRLKKMAGPGKRIVKVDLHLDPSNLDLVRERLAETRVMAPCRDE